MATEPHYTTETDTGAHDAERLHSDYWLQRRDQLFLACRIALITTAMSFAIRGALIDPLGNQFHLTKVQIGWVVGTAFWGFTLAQMIGGPLCDVWGMGRLFIFAAVGHAIGIVMTIFATGFWTLFISTLIFGLANGFVEAASNPMIATLYPDQKIKRLSQFHAWFPGGIVIGGLIAYGIDQAGIGGKEHGWQIQMATMLIPLVVYSVMLWGKQFPKTERVASGVSTAEMFKECVRPGVLLFVGCMLMTAATELVTGTWIPNVLTFTTGISGILFLVLMNGLMGVGRGMAGSFVHRLSPIAILVGSSICAAVGLGLLCAAHSAAMAFLAIVIFAVGVCYYWPTMLGVVSERFPKTGALGLNLMGGAGMLSTSLFLPYFGSVYDNATAAAAVAGGSTADKLKALAADPKATDAIKAQWNAAQADGGRAALQHMVILPIILVVIFAALYLYDKSRGGYREEVLIQDQQTAAA